MDEAKLIDKLRLIEVLFAGAATEGEKIAAECARDRILVRLKLWEKEAPPVEYRFSMTDLWSRKVFVALLRRYGIQPYRYSGQRHTTVMASVSRRFVNETLWPEFQEISEILRTYLSDVTDRVVRQVIHQDSSDAEVVEKLTQLPLSIDASPEADSQSNPSSQPHATGQDTGGAGPKGRGKAGRKKRKRRKRR